MKVFSAKIHHKISAGNLLIRNKIRIYKIYFFRLSGKSRERRVLLKENRRLSM